MSILTRLVSSSMLTEGGIWRGDDRIWGSHEVLVDISIVTVFTEIL